MTAEPKDGNSEPVKAQSRGRYSHKSAGRAEFMRRLNAEGRGGIGGRRPTHGQRMLVELLKRGLDEDTPVAALRREAIDGYVVDEGGAEEVGAKRKGIIRRMARLDLNLALLDAQIDKASTLPWKKQLELFAAIDRNAAAYNTCVKSLGGPDRRQKNVDKQIIVRRWATPEPPSPDNGSGTQESEG